MTFTDDDLKRLKEDLKQYSPHVPLSTANGHALVARLKAAEKVIGTQADHICHGEDCSGCEAWESWRKAAGK